MMEFSFNLLKFFENVISNAAAEVEIFDSSFDPQLRDCRRKIWRFSI